MEFPGPVMVKKKKEKDQIFIYIKSNILYKE